MHTKKNTVIFLMMALFGFALICCSDDDSDDNNNNGGGDNTDMLEINLENLIGRYKLLSSTEDGFVMCNDGDVIMRITGDQMGNTSNTGVINFPQRGEDGCPNGMGSQIAEFDILEDNQLRARSGRDILGTYTIQTFDKEKLIWEISPIVNPTATYTEEYEIQ